MQEEISKNILKSNTSIVGIVCKDGVVLAADRRSTAGTIVMSKTKQKIRKITDYVVAAYTGGVADIELSNKVIAAELRLKELRSKSRPTIKEAANFLGMMTYRSIRTPSMIPSIVGTLIAGVDEDGKASLYTIEPAGAAMHVEDYDANFSSGMPYILGLLERTYKKDLSVKEAIELAKECIKSSMQRDVGSGNGIDVFSITKEGIKHVISEELVPEYK
ncbi:proteasome subunit beta [Candidatus Pacearchaeota archaeon CG10_big_fil_rev_8_21_14_0_10_31_24]|nr:MAG: proteasome subunit beta [Candidatus Pacearchaeota archaeon CG10_big_fil_rev_8_21_14_0_10_31_24]